MKGLLILRRSLRCRLRVRGDVIVGTSDIWSRSVRMGFACRGSRHLMLLHVFHLTEPDVISDGAGRVQGPCLRCSRTGRYSHGAAFIAVEILLLTGDASAIACRPVGMAPRTCHCEMPLRHLPLRHLAAPASFDHQCCKAGAATEFLAELAGGVSDPFETTFSTNSQRVSAAAWILALEVSWGSSSSFFISAR